MKIFLHLSVLLCSFSYAQQIEVTAPKYTIPDSITIADGTKISREELSAGVIWLGIIPLVN